MGGGDSSIWCSFASALGALENSEVFAARVLRTAVEQFGEFLTNAELTDELLAALLSLDSRTVNMGGVDTRRAAAALQRALAKRLANRVAHSLVFAICAESGSPFLRRAAVMSAAYPSMQYFVFRRLYTTRALLWLTGKVLPRAIRESLATARDEGTLAPSASAPAGLATTHFAPTGDGTAGGAASSLSGECIAAGFAESLATHGALRTVAQTNLIEYATEALLEQATWARTYATAKPGRTRGIFKTHLTSAAMFVTEVALGITVRALGARLGHRIYHRNSLGAFWAENGFYFAASFRVALAVGCVGRNTLTALDRLMPANEEEAEMDREEEEAAHQQFHDEHQEFQDTFTAAAGGAEGTATDLYAVLGVAPDASTAEIKKAYYKKALEQHPDKLHGLPASERERLEQEFKIVTHAKSILTNADRRSDYDRLRRATQPPAVLRRLQTLPLPAKVAVSVVMVAGSLAALLGAAYAHSLIALRIFSQRGPGVVRMWS